GPDLPRMRSARPMPAQWIDPCRAPKCCTAACTAARALASSVTSVGWKRARWPSSAASRSPASRLRSAMRTLPPAPLSVRAEAAPRADAPPLTRNVRPETSMRCLRSGAALGRLALDGEEDTRDNGEDAHDDMHPLEGER